MEGLRHLLNASSKKAVQDVFLYAFERRYEPVTAADITKIQEHIALEPNAAEEVLPCPFTLISTLSLPAFSGFSLLSIALSSVCASAN